MDKQIVQNMEPHSVEISQNAKGETSFCVKVYAADETECVTRAVAARNKLREQLGK